MRTLDETNTHPHCTGLALAVFLTFLALAAFPIEAQDEECLDCHGTEDAAEAGDDPIMVHAPGWTGSIHAELGLGCLDCHDGIGEYPHEEGVEATPCSDCHPDAAEEYGRSVHAENREQNGSASAWPEGDACGVCHGIHDVRSTEDPASRIHPSNIPETCGSCHGDLEIVQAQGLSTRVFENYQHSVHGLRSQDPEARPAVCTSCHAAHLVIRADDPESPINPFNIPQTCGECHAEEAEEYSASVHGEAFRKGITTSPICTSCHGIHSIKMVEEAEGDTPLEKRLARTTCPACHSSAALMSEYGVTPARVRSYQASYHGLAAQRGATAVADCASCHGIHAIYPSTDSRSMVAPENLQATCGECHPGASEEFTRNPVHYGAGAPSIETTIVGWVEALYWGLILVVLGGMLLHNGIILGYHVRRKLRRERATQRLRRFTPSQVAQHAVLAVTFIALAVTGFMLAYPDVWWSRLFAQLGMTEDWRRFIHRAAAIGMIAASIYHVIWIWSTPYGRRELRRIFPRLRDMRELLENLRFHLGRGERPPAFGKYDYPAKLEYWALVWGTIVMAVTGVVLWFPMWATSFMPFWVVKVSEVIHLFEAWLATLAIVFFHFFFVIGHPEVYPVSLAMWNGKMTREEAAEKHPDWQRQLELEAEE